MSEPRIRQRVLAVNLAFDWKNDADRDLWRRLRDLGWQAAHYRNEFIRRRWAEAKGYRAAESDDPHGPTKEGRKTEKAELSAAAYGAAEREASAAWTRDCRRILAGAPLPEWRPTSALSIRGHKRKADSGVRIEMEDGQFVAYLQAQASTMEGGCWLRAPIKRGVEIDDWQAPILRGMVDWSIPIAKATIHLKDRRGVAILRLTYAVVIDVPPPGERVATLGPLEPGGALSLRIDHEVQQLGRSKQTKSYGHKLSRFNEMKDRWDFIYRRQRRKIGWRKNHARLKRQAHGHRADGLPPFDQWADTFLHTWTREVADYAASQSIGTIRVVGIDNGDWPAYRFCQMLTYKAEELGMAVDTKASLEDESTDRAVRSAIRKQKSKVTRVRRALRTIQSDIKESA